MKKTLLAILAASTLSGCFDDNNAVEKGMSQQYSDLSAAHLENDMKTRAIAAHYQANANNNMVSEVNGYFNIKNIMSTLTALEGLSTDTKAALAASDELQITKQMQAGAVASNVTTQLDNADFNDLIFASHDLNTDDDTSATDAAENNRVGPYKTQVSQAQANRFNSSVCHLVFGTKDNQGGQKIELSIGKKQIADADAKKILAAMEDHFYSCAKDPADQSKLMATGRVLVALGSSTKYEFLVNKNSREIYVENDEDEISVMINGKEVKAETGIYFSGAQNANQTKLEKLKSDQADQEAKKLIAAHKVTAVANARDPYLQAQAYTSLHTAWTTYAAINTPTDAQKDTLIDAINQSNTFLETAVTFADAQGAGTHAVMQKDETDRNLVRAKAAEVLASLAKVILSGATAEDLADDVIAFAKDENTVAKAKAIAVGTTDSVETLKTANAANTTELKEADLVTDAEVVTASLAANTAKLYTQSFTVLNNAVTEKGTQKAYDAEVAKIAGDNKTAYDAADKLITRLGYRIEAVEADIAVDAAKAAEKDNTDTAQAATLKKNVTDAEATAKTKAEVVEKLDAVEKAEAADKKTSTTATKSAVTKATKALTDLIATNDKAEADADA